MTSTVARESMLAPPPSELDSEGSSCGEDSRKRLRDDGNYPKKRRKQTTPVRFPITFETQNSQFNDNNDDNDDVDDVDDVDEIDDDDDNNNDDNMDNNDNENLNTEYRCQYCGRDFDDNNYLSHHLINEHGINTTTQLSSPTLQDNVRVKIENQQQQNQQDDNETPVNLSGISIKNFSTSSWLTNHGQDNDWSNQNQLTTTTLPPNHMSGMTYPGGIGQYLTMPGGYSLNDAGQLPRMPIGPAPMRIFNPDAYCELCHKEFCNKYFLKTHKANKHGIYTDPPSNSSENSGSSVFPGIPFSLGGIKIEQSQFQQQHQQQQQLQSSIIDVSLMPTIPCDICQKRFKNDELLKKHKQLNHTDILQDQQSESQSLPTPDTMNNDDDDDHDDDDRDNVSNSPSVMESLFKQEFGIEQEDTKFMPAPRNLSPQSIQQAKDSNFNIEKLRKLGILNTDAFCEICCKEYCNKYFLRTHKLKRHGILIQDDEKSPNNPGAAATWHQIQTSPLNLIISDSNNDDSQSNDKNNEEWKCKLCCIKFQTIELYKLHKFKIHNTNNECDKLINNNDEERTDSISEDLQKLQTMILQLNGIESSKSSTCGICGRECENQLTLKTHMDIEHNNSTNDERLLSSSSSPPSSQTIHSNIQLINNSNYYCTICEKDYQTQDLLRQHINDEHNQTSLSSLSTNNNNNSINNTIPPPQDKKLSSMTPTSSYCEICNKELCNKYFMKTHMQRMHGIEIENGSQIGGVICNICNKELCSKYFLRVHKHNTHGIVDENTTPTIKNQDIQIDTDDNCQTFKQDNIGDLSHRYFLHFTEICPICNTRFRSIKWLKTHLMSEHGRAGIDKWHEVENKYQNIPKNKFNNSSSSRTNNIQQNTNLKIPNGIDVTQTSLKNPTTTTTTINNDYTGNISNQVLTTLFGNNDEQQNKNYRCSYCSFTTPVLPFLFLHERSHTSNQENITSNTENNLQCPICSQLFLQPELLHHHLLTRHQLSGLLSQFTNISSSSIVNQIVDNNQERNCELFEQQKTDNNNEQSTISQLNNTTTTTTTKDDNNCAVEVTPQGAYKCSQCGFATANLNRIKKHVKKDHRCIGDPTECVISELSKTLKDVANKQKLPASYAMPQDINFNPDLTVMQPFIIEENDSSTCIDDTDNKKIFSSALVYLPVRTRVNSVLTASFTLSPA
ncbi:transcription factor stalky [Aphidius gifuensis]|uniref:transcription factor stalky n=1 Tax=Aphidius gifuensis TaxID=684658 RepID=UPI001CDD8F2C|nr:transcription factor stalky [Aphidius gifuensis]